MRKLIQMVLFFGFLILMVSCGAGVGGGGRVGVGFYHHHHGFFGPWWGSRTYFRDRIIVVPPDGGNGPTPEQLPIEPPIGPPDGGQGPTPELPIEPTVPMPQPSMEPMDMGMPDMDFGDFAE